MRRIAISESSALRTIRIKRFPGGKVTDIVVVPARRWLLEETIPEPK
jgi:hypothetical protein